MTYRLSSRIASKSFRPEPRWSASRASLLFGTALGCSIAILAAGAPDQAWAADECGADVGGVAVCTNVGNPYPTGIDYTGDAGEDITVVLLGSAFPAIGPVVVTNAVADDPGVSAIGFAGFDANVYVYSGVSIDANGIGILAGTVGGDATVETQAGVTITSDRTGIFSYAFGGDAAVYAAADITITGDGNPFGLATGAASIALGGDATTVSGGVVDVSTSTDTVATGVAAIATGYAGAGNYGSIEVDSYGTGDAYGMVAIGGAGATVLSTGTVDVYAYDGDATGVLALTGGDALILAAADITVVSQYESAYGVVAVGIDAGLLMAGDITVDGFGDSAGVTIVADDYAGLLMTGNVDVSAVVGSATAVLLTADDYDATASITGNVTADGFFDANGVLVYGYATATASVTGNVDVTAFLDNGIGVLAQATGVGSDAVVSVTGNVDVYGYDYAAGLAASGDDDAYVTVVGNVDVDTDNNDAFGVVVAAGDVADVSVDGSVYVNVGDFFQYAYGVLIETGGYAEVDVTGEVYVLSDFAYGIQVTNTGIGGVNIDVNDVNVYGYYDGAGIEVFNDYDTTIVANNINTTGDYVQGIAVYGDTFEAGDTDITVNDVTTAGDEADGILVIADYDVYVTSTGSISTTGYDSDGVEVDTDFGFTEVNVNNVSTLGDYADGVSAFGYFGAEVNATGDIYTGGANADGLQAVAYFGDATVTSSGATIETVDDYSTGIVAVSAFGNVYVNNSSDITTAGEDSYGIYAMAVFIGSGDVSVINTGDITTTGYGAVGIFAYAYDGATLVDHYGEIDTSGDFADGIYAYGYEGVRVYNADNTVVTSGYSATGITAVSATDYVYVYSGTVNTLGNFADGIFAVSGGGDAGVDNVIVESDFITTAGYQADGIVAAANYGDVTVSSFSIETTGDQAYGIYAYSYYGDININSSYVETSGYNADGISAEAYYQTTTIDSFSVDTTGDFADGIDAYGFIGVSVESGFVDTDGDYANGIIALAPAGEVYVSSFSVDTNGVYSIGILAVGAGGTTVYSSYVNTDGYESDGIIAANYGQGGVVVDSFSVQTDGDYAFGITAIAFAYYDSLAGQAYTGAATVESTFVETTGYNAYGIVAVSEGNNVYVDSYDVRTYGDHSTGIFAASYLYYDSGLLVDLTGTVYVDSNFVYTTGYDSEGIDTYNLGGGIDIESNVVVTRGDFAEGIVALAEYYYDVVFLTGYSGDVTIDSGSVFTYGDFADGITATAEGGDVTIYANNVLTFGLGSDAIVAVTGSYNGGNNDVFVATYATIYSYDGVGISVSASDDADIHVESGSVYGYDWGIQSYSGGGTYIHNDGVISGGEGRAIDVDGAAAFIVNDDTIYGYVDLTDNNDDLYNYGLWEAYGYSEFRGGIDVVRNYGTVGFSRGTGAPEFTAMYGLEFFDNYGLVTGVDGQVDDYLYITGNFHGGLGDSLLALDVELGGVGSTADVLVIGSASGVTEILPNDLLAASPGVLNFGGILVVDSANPAEGGAEFVMDNVDKGFVEYELFFDAANDDWLIVGLPDDEAFEMMMAASIAQDFWHRSGDAMSARWQEIRDSGAMASMGPGDATRGEGWELWMQAHGGDESFEEFSTFVVGGFTFTQDLSHDSDWRGFQFGADNLTGDMLWGFTMGFVQQETEFTFDSNSLDFEGWNVGAYVGWASGGFFLNGLLKADWYEVDANFTTIPTMFSFDGVTWGAQGEIGYRWNGGGSWFLEPIASIAWSTTDLDDAAAFGAGFSWDDADSLYGKAGARLGTTFGTGDVVLTPYIGVYAVEEFDGENTFTFSTGPTAFTIQGDQRDGYGLVDFGFTAQTFYGLEGFLKGEWNFGGDADGGAARLGVRWRW